MNPKNKNATPSIRKISASANISPDPNNDLSNKEVNAKSMKRIELTNERKLSNLKKVFIYSECKLNI